MVKWLGVPENIDDYQGFVYLIRKKDGSLSYIGQKNYWKIFRAKPLKGYKRVRLQRKETDWKTYNSSNTIIQDLVEKEGVEAFEWIILLNCESKAELRYFELYFQMKFGVLFDEHYKNGIINIRLSENAFPDKKKMQRKIAELEYKGLY